MTTVTRSFSSLRLFRTTKGVALQGHGASVIHVQCMEELTRDAVREIEEIHSRWIEFEVAGQWHNLMAVCADDIELWPPDSRPVLGRTAVSEQMGTGLRESTALRLPTVVSEAQTGLRT